MKGVDKQEQEHEDRHKLGKEYEHNPNLIENENDNDNENNNSNDSSQMIPPLEPNYKTQSLTLENDIRIFIVSLSLGIAIFLLFMGLGIFLTIYKSTMFGKIFLAMSVFALIIIIFNLISVCLFKKKFEFFVKKGQESRTDIEILEQGESYEELLKSTESSLMNLGLYLIMTLIVIFAIFAVSCISFNNQMKSEVNVYANNRNAWKEVYQTYTYSNVIWFLTGFMIGLGIISLVTCGYLSYLFYLAFKILGFFHIYQKIVQFLSMLFLQLGIAFLYLTVYSNRFKDLSIINPSLPEWIPIALLVCSIIVIGVAICGYVGATTKSTSWLIFTCVATGLFNSMFIVIAFCSVISAHSLEKFSDTQCPAFVDYFNQNYIQLNNQCDKYTETNTDFTKLNCPKERIVKAWEINLNDPLISSNNDKKESYGCINISCCYKVYNFVQIFWNYISLFCFCLIAFGLVLIGTSFYLITLLEQKVSVGVEEKASQYFVYCFVGIVTVFFIVLLSKIKKSEYSPSYSIQFVSANLSNTYGIDTLFLPYSVQKDNTTQLHHLYETVKNQIKSRSILMEDTSMCRTETCNLLQYQVTVKSETVRMKVNQTLALKNQIEAVISDNDLKVVLTSLYFQVSYLYPDLIIFESVCQLEKKMTTVVISATGMDQYLSLGPSFVQLKKTQMGMRARTEINSGLDAKKSSNKDEREEDLHLYFPEINGDVNVTQINMSKVKIGKTYYFFNEQIDFSLIDGDKTQTFKGIVYVPSPDHKLSASPNHQITMQYPNFQSCKKEIITTNSEGEFTLKDIPVLKNYIINEVKLYFDNNELIKTINVGGAGYEQRTQLPIILLQKNNDLVFADENLQNLYSFTSNIIDAVTLKPIEHAICTVYEGEIYVPNTKSNTTKYDIAKLEIFATIQTDENGSITITKLLKEVYTISIQKEFYYKEIITVNPKSKIYSIPLTPMIYSKNQFRIVLTWPKGPTDLNLFSYFKVTQTMQCEVFFGNRNCQRMIMNSNNYNNGTQGVQVITIEEVGNYNYGFAVSQFNINDNPKKRNETKAKGAEKEAPKWEYPSFMRNFTSAQEEESDILPSEASLSIYLSNYQMKVYSVSLKNIKKISNKDNKMIWWYAFCFNGNEGIKSLKVINKFSDTKPNFQMCSINEVEEDN